jgi:hypothetical protein
MHACSYIRAASYTDERIADAGPAHTHARTCCVRAHACVRAIGRAHIRADTCERLPSAWTAGGSTRRRSTVRRRSTRTSARGTPRVSSRCTRYAPPFRAGLARRHRRGVRARVCTDVWVHACAVAHVCRYSCAYKRRVLYTHVYIYVCDTYTYVHSYLYIYLYNAHTHTHTHTHTVCVCVCVCVCIIQIYI